MTKLCQRRQRIDKMIAQLERTIDRAFSEAIVNYNDCRLLLDGYSALEMIAMQQMDGAPFEAGPDA